MKSQEEISLKNRPESLKPEGDWSNIFSYHPMDVELKRSEGIHYFDVNDNKYIDVTSGPFAFSLPHNDPRMKKAIADQMEAFSHITPTMANRPLANYSAKLQEVTPPKLNTVYPVSGGSEAVETAIKVAREHHVTNGNTDKYKIISNYQSYHGMTLATQGLSGNPAYAKKYGAILNKWPHIHQYSDHEKPEGMSREDWGIKCAQELEKAIYFEGANSVAAYIATPHGCGSEYAVVPPKEYWQEIRRICDHYNVLLIADEVVTGFGRTGKWFAMEHFGVEVDIMTIAKGMSGCYVPMGGVVISDEINEAFIKNNAVFAHGFTNSGNPLAAHARGFLFNLFHEKVMKSLRHSQYHGSVCITFPDGFGSFLEHMHHLPSFHRKSNRIGDLNVDRMRISQNQQNFQVGGHPFVVSSCAKGHVRARRCLHNVQLETASLFHTFASQLPISPAVFFFATFHFM